MLFGSLEFALFLPAVFALYWSVPQAHRPAKNWVLLIASYIFYGWWDWRFLSLMFGSSIVNFAISLRLASSPDAKRRYWLVTSSILVNLGLLGTFKYFNFFLASLTGAFSFLGLPVQGTALDIVLPVGISFYTFQTMSYTIDVYRRRLEATRELIPFLTYVAFFPQLVAGPIERATNLLPQFHRQPPFDEAKAVDGLRQMLWGFFKKTVIADSCAPLVAEIFNNPGGHSGSTLLLGAVLFAFQIYGDFSGYSDIAIGVAKLFGFDLMQNFAYPYFSRDIAEFWRRWHISLSTWFRDYVYIPLGGSRGGKLQQVRNTIVIFLISGLWHGANWTFVAWGFLHAVYFLPLLLWNRNRRHLGPIAIATQLPTLTELVRMAATFFLVTVAWIFFRADSIEAAFSYLARMLDPRAFGRLDLVPARVLFFIVLMLGVEWLNRDQAHALARVALPRPVRWACYLGVCFAVLLLGADGQTFIYFQF